MDKNGGKTIFVVVDLGMSIRNILRTNVFATLRKRPDLNIVIFSPLADAEFRAEFEAENVRVEPLRLWPRNQILRMIDSLKKEVWNEMTTVASGVFSSFNIKRMKKKRRLVRFLLRRYYQDAPIEKLTPFLQFLERLEWKLTPRLERDVFARYKPDMAFFSSVFTRYLSINIAAKQHGVKMISFMQSWDNATSKGPFPVTPDRIIAWNEISRDETIKYHRFPQEKIHVAGAPQFDHYLDRDGFLPREDFFRKWGLDPDRKLITYTTGSANMLPDEHEVAEMLHEQLQKGAFACPAQLLVRLHQKDSIEYYRRLEGLPGLVLQEPGRRGGTRDNWNPTREDMYGLAELMHYSDVVLNVTSTISIDAACFDTPIVNIAFDGRKKKPYLNSCVRYYDFNHYRNIVETGGVRIAYDIDMAVEYINAYLRDPSLDRDGREQIRRRQCWRFDGKAGERIAGHVLDYLDA